MDENSVKTGVAITKEQLIQLKNELNAWCEERHLTIFAQKQGLITNILEEIREVALAPTINDKVGELCDIIVFTLNAIKEDERDKVFDFIKKFKTIEETFVMPRLDRLLRAITALADEELRLKDTSSLDLGFFVFLALEAIEELGFDSFLAMEETIKKINSRKGKYDESLNKWVKDTSPEAKAEYYEPNYDICAIARVKE